MAHFGSVEFGGYRARVEVRVAEGVGGRVITWSSIVFLAEVLLDQDL